MNLEAEKEFVKNELDKVEDIHLVETVKNILSFAQSGELHPMSRELFLKRNALSRSAIESGDLIDHEVVKSHFTKKNGR